MTAMNDCRQHVYRHCQLNPEQNTFVCVPREDDGVMTRWLFGGQGYNSHGRRDAAAKRWASAQVIPSSDGTFPHRCDQHCSAVEFGPDFIMCLESGEVHACTMSTCPYVTPNETGGCEYAKETVVCPVSAYILGMPAIATRNHDTADLQQVLTTRFRNRHVHAAVAEVAAQTLRTNKRKRLGARVVKGVPGRLACLLACLLAFLLCVFLCKGHLVFFCVRSDHTSNNETPGANEEISIYASSGQEGIYRRGSRPRDYSSASLVDGRVADSKIPRRNKMSFCLY